MGILLRLRNMVPGVDWVLDEDGAECAGHPSNHTAHSKDFHHSFGNDISSNSFLDEEGKE